MPPPRSTTERVPPHELFKKYLGYVSEKLSVKKVDIIGHGRKREVVVARHVLIWLLTRHMNMSEIARKLDVDHTTVLHALKKISAKRNIDLEFKQQTIVMVQETKNFKYV